MPLWALPFRLVCTHTHIYGLDYSAACVPVLNSFHFVSSSHCWGECDCQHNSWSSSKPFPAQQTPGVFGHARNAVCESGDLALLTYSDINSIWIGIKQQTQSSKPLFILSLLF